jgi:hypothetical protein
MKTDSSSSVTAAGVVARIQSEIAEPSETGLASPFAERMAHLQLMQREFRRDPVGGRLVGLKKLFAWFSASTFDRQAKVIEALLDLVEDLGAELDRQQREINRLGAESRGPGSLE